MCLARRTAITHALFGGFFRVLWRNSWGIGDCGMKMTAVEVDIDMNFDFVMETIPNTIIAEEELQN